VVGDKNTTIIFNIEKRTMKEVSDNDNIRNVNNDVIDADLNYWSENITAPTADYHIKLNRKVTADDIYNMDPDMMPGFRLTWNYNRNIEPVDIYSNLTKTKQFVRLVSMLDKVQLDQEKIWKIVRQIRKSFLSQLKNPKCQNSETLLSDTYIKDNIDVVEETFKQHIEIKPKKSLSHETLQFAANLFTYLSYCPTKDFYVLSVIKSESAKNILLALISMMKTSKNAGIKTSTEIFTKAMEMFQLISYKDMDAINKEKGFDDWRNDLKHHNERLKVLGH